MPPQSMFESRLLQEIKLYGSWIFMFMQTIVYWYVFLLFFSMNEFTLEYFVIFCDTLEHFVTVASMSAGEYTMP